MNSVPMDLGDYARELVADLGLSEWLDKVIMLDGKKSVCPSVLADVLKAYGVTKENCDKVTFPIGDVFYLSSWAPVVPGVTKVKESLENTINRLMKKRVKNGELKKSNICAESTSVWAKKHNIAYLWEVWARVGFRDAYKLTLLDHDKSSTNSIVTVKCCKVPSLHNVYKYMYGNDFPVAIAKTIGLCMGSEALLEYIRSVGASYMKVYDGNPAIYLDDCMYVGTRADQMVPIRDRVYYTRHGTTHKSLSAAVGNSGDEKEIIKEFLRYDLAGNVYGTDHMDQTSTIARPIEDVNLNASLRLDVAFATTNRFDPSEKLSSDGIECDLILQRYLNWLSLKYINNVQNVLQNSDNMFNIRVSNTEIQADGPAILLSLLASGTMSGFNLINNSGGRINNDAKIVMIHDYRGPVLNNIRLNVPCLLETNMQHGEVEEWYRSAHIDSFEGMYIVSKYNPLMKPKVVHNGDGRFNEHSYMTIECDNNDYTDDVHNQDLEHRPSVDSNVVYQYNEHSYKHITVIPRELVGVFYPDEGVDILRAVDTNSDKVIAGSSWRSTMKTSKEMFGGNL